MVRAYSSQTGEWIRDLEGANAEIVHLQTDPTSPLLVYACTVTGQVVSWKWRSGVVHETIALRFSTAGALVRSFHIVDLGDKRPYGLAAWSPRAGCPVQCSVFDFGNGVAQDLAFGMNLTYGRLHNRVSK